ncbi:MAG: alkaline phosphatase family protein [Deltaproteobacteria bacterium]|nr:alkaline phosphatase family protein [Deltaproteobacteria bacterium]
MDPTSSARPAALPLDPPVLVAGFLLSLTAVAAGYWMGDDFIPRFANHRGYFMVEVDDHVPMGTEALPRHATFVLVDGLRADFAEKLGSVARLRAEGQCRLTDVGALTVSTPVYAEFSTGLEQDRTGSRTNDEPGPLSAESFWQVARRSGRTVRGVSELPFWQRLFPDGFTEYTLVKPEENAFARATPSPLLLIHPVYVDQAGHDHGAASTEYAHAVRRVDAELSAFLDRIDPSRDLIIFTADHGHTDAGGHGGPSPEIRRVLTCFSGAGIVRREQPTELLDGRSLAAIVSVLLGLPFPRHMRAGEDGLGELWEIVDRSKLNAAFADDRDGAIERFRAANRDQLAVWLGASARPTWSSLYDRERNRQWLRGAGLGSLVLGGVVWVCWRRHGKGGVARWLIWTAANLVLTLGIFARARGGLDFSAVNTRDVFIPTSLLIASSVALLGVSVHWAVVRSLSILVVDQVLFVALALGWMSCHVATFGRPFGFPIPGPEVLFFGLFGPIFVVVQGLFGVALSSVAFVLVRRARRHGG